MKNAWFALVVGATILTATTTPAPGQHKGGHQIFRPDDIPWKDAVGALPPGAKIAVLDGDPSKDEPFAMRLKFPAGYRIMPHTHTKTERLTVISGTFNVGFGEAFDEKVTHALPSGTFGSWAPGVPHFGWVGNGEVVVQLNSVGPWTVTYVNPADDPRKK